MSERPSRAPDYDEAVVAEGRASTIALEAQGLPLAGQCHFVSDDGEALVGDLRPLRTPDEQRYLDNWEVVRRASAKLVFPSHAEVFRLMNTTDTKGVTTRDIAVATWWSLLPPSAMTDARLTSSAARHRIHATAHGL